MIHLRLILVFFIFSNFPAQVSSQESGELYLWKVSSGQIWETFGDEDIQQKYKGIVANGKPDGEGSLTHPDGGTIKGEWRNGKEWNTTHINKDGIILGNWVNGRWKLKWGVLFLIEKEGKWGWFKDGDKEKHTNYLGSVQNWAPNGQGELIFLDGENYVGEFKKGQFNGRGTYSWTDGSEYSGNY